MSSIQAYSHTSSGAAEPHLAASSSRTFSHAAAGVGSPSPSASTSESRVDTPDTQQQQQPPQQRVKLDPGQIDFKQRQLVMMYTCGQCEVRSAKAFSKIAYNSGVVIVQCPGCGARHLIADHLGWFGSAGTIEEFAQERGQTVVTRLADDTLELTPEDMVGSTAHAAALKKSENER